MEKIGFKPFYFQWGILKSKKIAKIYFKVLFKRFKELLSN